jgi:hypothetical protein
VTDEPADRRQEEPPAAWDREHRWPPWYPVPFLVVVIAVVQLLLPPSVTIGPIWLIPAIELIGIPLVWAIWHLARTDRFPVSDEVLGKAMAAYLCFLAAASALNAALLLRTLLYDVDDTPGWLLVAGFAVLAINVLTFGLIYWWIDGGGPRRRATGRVERWDFQFPQQAAGQHWTPTMIDYLFTAYTNIIAFSPTDTMPLSHRVKALFTVQSTISLVTVLVTVSRAINMLPL